MQPSNAPSPVAAPFLNSPAVRLVAEGRILAGFLSEESAGQVIEVQRAAPPTQAKIRERFGKIPAPGGFPITPSFRYVDEPEVVDVLRGVAPQTGVPALSNLMGFEWLTIESILAGHAVAAPMPLRGRVPNSAASAAQIARYCLIGAHVMVEDLVPLQTGDLLSPEMLRLNLAEMNFDAGKLTVTYAVDQRPSPIAVLVTDRRAIAVRHQERLVALSELGVQEALCLVYYGHGTDVLALLPTFDAQLLLAERPPMVRDFSNDDLTVRIGVPTPKALVRLSQEVIDLSPRV